MIINSLSLARARAEVAPAFTVGVQQLPNPLGGPESVWRPCFAALDAAGSRQESQRLAAFLNHARGDILAMADVVEAVMQGRAISCPACRESLKAALPLVRTMPSRPQLVVGQ